MILIGPNEESVFEKERNSRGKKIECGLVGAGTGIL